MVSKPNKNARISGVFRGRGTSLNELTLRCFAASGELNVPALRIKISERGREISRKVAHGKISQLLQLGVLEKAGSTYFLTFKGTLLGMLVERNISIKNNVSRNSLLSLAQACIDEGVDPEFVKKWVIDGIVEMLKIGFINPDLLPEEHIPFLWLSVISRLSNYDLTANLQMEDFDKLKRVLTSKKQEKVTRQFVTYLTSQLQNIPGIEYLIEPLVKAQMDPEVPGLVMPPQSATNWFFRSYLNDPILRSTVRFIAVNDEQPTPTP